MRTDHLMKAVYILLIYLTMVPSAEAVPAGASHIEAGPAEAAPAQPEEGNREAEKAPTPKPPPRHLAEVVPWFWDIAGDKAGLARLAVVAIALLSAFLTVVQLWEVPPPNTRPVTSVSPSPNSSSPAGEEGSAATAQAAGVPLYGTTTLLFRGNFGRTVLSGLAGLALVSTFDGFWQVDDVDGKEQPYFLVLFVTFFLSVLILTALARGVTEAIRSRISIVRRYPRRARRPSYYLLRAWSWILSLRIPALVFADTVFNVILGRNQLRTAEFENELARLHESIIWTVDRIRDEIDETITAALNQKVQETASDCALGPQREIHEKHKEPDVRVGISVMAQDELALYYISRERGSVAQGFAPDSIAWLSVHTGQPLWWKRAYTDYKNRIVLLENEECSSGVPDLMYPALKKGKLFLRDYVQWRGKPDYGAFIVLPVPWRGREASGDRRKAGIHISFKHPDDLKLLWKGMDTLQEKPEEQGKNEIHKGDLKLYEHCSDLLEHKQAAVGASAGPSLLDEEVSEVLKRSLSLLSDLLSSFNDVVFEEYVRPRLRPQ